jgi:hypothetical protein
MELIEIKKLLEKYYEGTASLQEEQQLRNYFQNNQVSDELSVDKELFAYVQLKISTVPSSVGLETKLSNWVDDQEKKEEKSHRMTFLLKISGIAAGIVILLASYIVIYQYNEKKKRKDTFKDPLVAYAEVKRTLLYISEQMNRGTQPLEHMSKMNDGMVSLSSLSAFGSGLKELELVSKYYDESKTENINTK